MRNIICKQLAFVGGHAQSEWHEGGLDALENAHDVRNGSRDVPVIDVKHHIVTSALSKLVFLLYNRINKATKS